MFIVNTLFAVVVISSVSAGLVFMLSASRNSMTDDYLFDEAKRRNITVLVRMTPVQATGEILKNMLTFAQACSESNIKHPIIILKRDETDSSIMNVFAEWRGALEPIGKLLPELAGRLMMFDDATPIYGAVAHYSISANHPIIKVHIGVPNNPTYRQPPDNFDALDYLDNLLDKHKDRHS